MSFRRPISAVPKAQVASVALAAIAVFVLVRVLFPGWSTGSPLLTLARESVLLLLVAGVWFCAVRGERIDPVTLGFRRPTWSSVGWGLVGAIALLAAGVAFSVVLSAFHLHQDTETLGRLAQKPLPIILLIAFTAAVTEEIIFRSILIDHLGRLAHNELLGALGSILMFSAAHISGWGAVQLLFVLPSGLILTILFLWKRDIAACMIAHFLIDALGLIAASTNGAH